MVQEVRAVPKFHLFVCQRRVRTNTEVERRRLVAPSSVHREALVGADVSVPAGKGDVQSAVLKHRLKLYSAFQASSGSQGWPTVQLVLYCSGV